LKHVEGRFVTDALGGDRHPHRVSQLDHAVHDVGVVRRRGQPARDPGIEPDLRERGGTQAEKRSGGEAVIVYPQTKPGTYSRCEELGGAGRERRALAGQ
jgi:hypothetical protein